jgi:hypothetical protein
VYVSNYGNGALCGFGENYVIVNAENGNEIARLYSSNVGQFKHANGRLVVFKDGGKLVVYEVGFPSVSEISSRYA